jgi:DHA1 family tetracycline resistance protein-like MFS transporter
MNKRLLVILSVIALDAVGIGLIFPILPSLLKELTVSGDVSVLYGVMLAIYAFMQFVFSPVLGAMSDRYGRRPVLLASIAGATVDYLIMAFSPSLSVLFVGRAIAGLTSANMAVATTYIADITEESDRAKRFGQMSACFGLGFIVGPILGGVVGESWLRGPFLIAAVLNAANLALVYFVLPESRTARERKPFELGALNPLGPVRWAFGKKVLQPLLGLAFLFNLVGNIPASIWVLYGQDRFQWDRLTTGLSLAAFGICHAVAQGLLTGKIKARFGEVKTIIVGIVSDSSSLLVLALASRGWVAFALSPFFALGGVGIPALQSLTANQVGEDQQGELQGVLASITSLTAIVGPLVGTTLYSLTRTDSVGAVWIFGAGLYVFAVPLLWLARPRAPVETSRTAEPGPSKPQWTPDA